MSMKHKTLTAAAAFLLCIALTACAAPQPAATPTPAATKTQEPMPEIMIPEAPDPLIQQRVTDMLPAMDSVIRALQQENVQYAPKDPEFFWSTMYLMGVNFGEGHPPAAIEGEYMKVPRKVMQEFASAAFFEYDDLPQIPDSLAPSAKYDEAMDAYLLGLSDIGDTWTMLDDFQIEPDGTILADVGLYGGDGKISSYRFKLTDNPYVSGIAEPMYFYSIVSAEAVQ